MPETIQRSSSQRGREWDTYRRLARYAVPYLPRLLLGTVFGVLFAGSTTSMVLALRKMLGAAFDPAGASWRVVLAAAALLPLLAALRGIGHYLSVYFIEWVGQRVVMDLRTQAFAHVHDLSMAYFSTSRTGELISRVTNDTVAVEKSVSTVLGDLVRQPFTILGMVAVLFWLDARLAGISFVLFPICIIPVAIFGRRVRRFAREGQQYLADMVSILQESITGVRVVKAFGMEDYERKRFNERVKTVFSRLMKVTRAKAALDPVIVFISVIGLSLVLLYSRWVHMELDHLVTFAIALVALYEPVKNLSKIHLSIQASSAAADRIFELMDAPVSVRDMPGAVEFNEPVETIQFDRVSFAYDSEPVLSGINVSVKAGQRIALVGGSGAGKSTMVSLLPRFYDVTEGAIRINGRDLRKISLHSLRRMMGLVTQETILFNDTVAANIAYGQTGASLEKIRDAARRAHAHDFIMEMEKGYDTVIGERGVRLSGGQCQRLAIARAILRNPPILILDEATSALDTESERQVQAALDDLVAGRTVFAIAHRLSTIIHSDRILVLDRGAIVEEGSHDELLARGGVYKRLYDLQFKDYE